VVSGLLVILAAVILIRGVLEGSFGRAAIYFLAIGLSVVLVDSVLAWTVLRSPQIPVRNPRFEFAVTAVIGAGALAWLWTRFVWNYQPQGIVRLVWLAVLLGCVFDAFLAIFLIARRYSLGDLGLRGAGLLAAPPVIAIFATFAFVFTQSSITWSRILEDTGGSWLAVVATALSAGVPEEFSRFVWQTRAGAWLGNRAAGWLIASCVWAALHGPKVWGDSHSMLAVNLSVLNIIPLGLLWGYVTHRTRSILPSMLIHATNVWGLQNLP